MIDVDLIERLIKVLDGSGVDTLEIERGGTRIRMSKSPPAGSGSVVVARDAVGPVQAPTPRAEQPAAAAEPAPPVAKSSLLEITSPMVGTFYRAPAPDAPPYIEPGKRITPGDTLCIIEAMKLMNELEAEVSGTIVEVCVDNAQPVEYGQVLFRVDPS